MITSIAVLPLKSLSDDPNHEYLADGLTDSITSELAKIRSLKVISNTSAVRYKNTDLTMPEIAKALGVDGLIEGSLFREGNDVRITVQLIHGPSDAHVWSESYTGTVTSIMQLQSEVALAIADALGAKLTGDERSRIASAQEVDPEAYDAYVIGNHYLNQLTEDGLNTAIRYFEKAVNIDPEYAHAWGGMVCAYWEMAAHGLGRPREIYPKARSAGMRALQLNADMSTDQSHMGMIAMGYDHEWDQAEERFQFALRFAPSNSFALHDYARFLSFVGRDEEALQYALVAEDLDPMPTLLAPYLARETIRIESDPQRARRNMEQLRAANPEFLQALDTLTRVYRTLAMPEDALGAADEWVELSGRDAPSLTSLALTLGAAGQDERARIVLEEIAAKDDYFDSAAVGYAYVSLDDLDAAFEWLEKGYDSRDWGITRLRTIPYWKIYIDTPSWIRFRNDPRYRDLIERVGFPPLPPEHPGYAEEQAWLGRKARVEDQK
ncbi:MAG: hypothetical protein IIB38_15180 [Candidatus Hydrogenedentes bacterium]|nr:hypothetical protein [Candidatus Hydrogenedentota bacterium]